MLCGEKYGTELNFCTVRFKWVTLNYLDLQSIGRLKRWAFDKVGSQREANLWSIQGIQ